MTPREERGLVIAATQKLMQKGRVWIVPSQNGGGKYTVALTLRIRFAAARTRATIRNRSEGKHYVYLWADGVYFNIRLEEDRQCLLVLMGATPDGKKELIAVAAGHRESEQSWLALLLDCKARGMKVDPLLATGDGALGFWKALPQVWSTTRTQRCWVHKTVNVLDKLPKSQHGAAKKMLHNIYLAERRKD